MTQSGVFWSTNSKKTEAAFWPTKWMAITLCIAMHSTSTACHVAYLVYDISVRSTYIDVWPHILENIKWPHLCNASSDPLHVCSTTMLCPQDTIHHCLHIWRDHLHSVLKQCSIPAPELESLAACHSTWCSTCHDAVVTFEARRTEARQLQWQNRHLRQAGVHPPPGNGVICPVCIRRCTSNFGLRSHMQVHNRTWAGVVIVDIDGPPQHMAGNRRLISQGTVASWPTVYEEKGMREQLWRSRWEINTRVVY